MTWIRMILALGLPALCGYAFISCFIGGVGWERRALLVFLGFGAGLGIVSLVMFLMGVADIPYSGAAITAALSALTIVFIVVHVVYPAPAPMPEPRAARPHVPDAGRATRLRTILAVVLVVWIGLKVCFVLYDGFSRPIVSQDSWWNWSSGAKFFFYNRGLLLDPADEHFLGRGYRVFIGYPLLNTLSQTWTSYALGGFHESLAKAWVSLFYVSVLGTVFFTIKKEAGPFIALITAFFLSSAPLLTYHSFDAYSDLPLAFYVLSGAILMWRYMDGYGGRRTAALSGVFFAMGAFTKNEGLVYLGAAALALLAYNIIEKEYRWKDLLYFIIPAALYIGPWIIFKAYYSIGYGHGYGIGVGKSDVTGAIPMAAEVHFEVVPIFLKELLLSVNHAMVFPFLILAALIVPCKFIGSKVKYLYLIIAVAISALLFIYATTSDYIYILNRAAANRNILAFVPLAFLAAGLMAAKLLDRD